MSNVSVMQKKRGNLSTRFSADPDSFQQQLANLTNCNISVMNYSSAIIGTQLPNFGGNAPDWWSGFVTNFSEATQHAQDWQTSILPDLTAVPQSIVNYNELFGSNVTMAEQYLNLLISNPNDSQALASLSSTMSSLVPQIQSYQQDALNLSSQISGFIADLQQDVANLQAGLTAAQQQTAYDAGQVTTLTGDIANLQQQINTYNQLVTASYIGLGISIFVATIGIAVAFVTFGAGAAVIAVGVAGIGGSVAAAVVLSEKIRSDQAQIGTDQANISLYNQQVALLQALINSLTQLIALAQTAFTDVQTLYQAWQLLETQLGSVVSDLTSADQDLAADDFQAMLTELQTASADWGALQPTAQAFASISYNVTATPAVIPQAA